MKRTLFIIFSILCLSTAASGWSRVGHATVAQVAENHLSKKARRTLDKYLEGKSITEIASDADKYRSVWTLDLGFVPTNPEASRVAFLKDFDFTTPLNISPYSHSVTVDENFKSYLTDNLDGAYINNDAYYVARFTEQLKKHAKDMDPFERYKAIALIVHFLGDMHCPMHIVYLKTDPAKGAYNVIFRGSEVRLHNFWDKTIFESAFDLDFHEMARLVDIATKDEIKDITKGDIYDWTCESARDSWVCHQYQAGDTLPDKYPYEIRSVLFSQLRNGGYRLAALLNYIFG